MNLISKKKITLALGIFLLSFLGFFATDREVIADGCQVTAADFRTGAPYPTNSFTFPGNRTAVYIDVKTNGCIGEEVGVTVTANIGDDIITDWEDLENANGIDVPITEGHENFTLEFRSTEEGCVGRPLNDWDCIYAIETDDSDSGITGERWHDEYTSSEILGANTSLLYDCGGGLLLWCPAFPDDWERVGEVFPYQYIDQTDIYSNPPDADIPPVVPADSYLAPLPGFNSESGSNLGEFLRALFTLLIVVAGILAFIMIVVGAITYASTDAFSGKSAGKDMILNAIMGLVLALGAWIILNTINPNLASNLSITIPKASINPANEPEDSVGAGINQVTLNVEGGGTTTVNNCDQAKMTSTTAFGGHTFKIYKGLVGSIQSVSTAWEAAGGDNFYQIDSIAGYNCRKVKGTNSWSAHAFGLAVDINPDKNPFGSTLVTDMPPTFVQMWTAYGWGWGGAWTSRKDAMHFSKHPTSEGGDNTVAN